MTRRRKTLKQHAQNKPRLLKGKSRLEYPQLENYLSFNFKQIDQNQGQSFSDWNDDDLLVTLLERLQSFSSMTIDEAKQNRLNIYDTFPAHSDFRHPDHVPPDASWASLHIQGKQCVGGHLIGTVFYIVFLDKDHRFYPTKKRHT